MTEQLNLLTHARNTDPSTSHRAATAVDINRKCREVLGVLWSHRFSSPCFTDGDLASWCQDDRNIVARRRGDLQAMGLVEPVYDAGEHAERLDGRGRMAKLWTISEYGYAVAAEVLAA